MTFERPVLLWALGVMPALALLALRERRHLGAAARAWSRVPGVGAASRLPTAGLALLQFLLLAGGFACATIGFAAPARRDTITEPVWENVYVGLLIDLSRSTSPPSSPVRSTARAAGTRCAAGSSTSSARARPGSGSARWPSRTSPCR